MTNEQCSGKTDLTIPELYALWTNTNTCWSYYDNVLFNNIGQRRYNPNGLESVQIDITNLFRRYLREYQLTQPGDPKYNSFQNVLLQICNTYPGSCEPFLNNFCFDITPDQAATNTGLSNFCGCFLNYTETYGLTQECQPLCQRVSNVKISNNEGGYKRCESNTCVIDQVSINASKSATGNVSFTQVCRCPAGKCKCIISNVNLYSITGNVNFNQVCENDSVCYQASNNPNQPLIQVPCPEVITPPSTTPSSTYSWLVTLVIVLIIALVLIILVYYIR